MNRQDIVDEAMTWEGTPAVPHGRVKGRNGGCDCLTFIAGVYENAGAIDRIENMPHYPHDWHLHQKDELYLNGKDGVPGVLGACFEFEGPPLPGDIVMYKYGHCYAHGVIVLEWPRIIHSWCNRPVGPDDASRRTSLMKIHEIIELRNQPRPKKFFRLRVWA